MTATRLAIVALAAYSLSCLAQHPIAPGSPKSVSGLIGRWGCVSPDERDPSVLSVTESGLGFRAEFAEVDPKDSGAWTGYAVRFEGKNLLNLQMEGDEEKKWTVAEYTMALPTVLHIEYPYYDNKTFNGATTPTQLREALSRGYRAKTLFDDSLTCVRIRPRASQE